MDHAGLAGLGARGLWGWKRRPSGRRRQGATGEAWRRETRTSTGVLSNETNHNQFLMHPNIVGNTVVMAFCPGGTWVLDMATREATKVKAAYRCSPAAASRTNSFYRAGYSSTFDLSLGSGAPLTRITRPSCWISMLPAGGLIMMPEYGSTSCRCGYPIQTSVVMAPREDK